ncbi:MAG: Fe-S cluster assembly protein SufD [Lysobacteraceae bacterium]|nr:MAG: Fe-S cluster assembly protein SufD [Xanthomonadaceae bacterium]
MAVALLESLLEGVPAGPAARSAAVAALRRDGLPGTRDEAWKYTALRALEQRRLVAGDAGAAAREVDAATYALPGIEGPRLVFVNGVFRVDLSDQRELQGLTLSPLSSEPARLASLLDAGEGERADAFERLNTALVADGALVRVANDARIGMPLHLVFIGTSADADLAWQARVRVELGEGAALTLVEHHAGTGVQAHLGNLVADYVLAAGARLDLLQLQDAGADSTLVRRDAFRLDRGACVSAHALELGARLVRHDFRVDLAGPGSRLVSRGTFALTGRQHADTRLDVRHLAPDTACDIAWRGAADQRSRGVFHGAITIESGADGADARLSNRNLLLSAQAEIDTQPVLVIHADEVAAAHGATVGQLDEQALFYLRTRGIPREAARRLLVSAFCGATLDGISPDALRAHLLRLLAQRLPLVEGA